MDDSRLVVEFVRGKTPLVWTVSDPQEVHQNEAGVVCSDDRPADSVIDGRSVFLRRERHSDTAWMCIPVSGSWEKGFPLDKLTISLRQQVGRSGQLEPSELERMVASAHPAPPGRASGSDYELPTQGEIELMAASFRRPILLPRELPDGFIYSQWYEGDPFDTGERRPQLSITFARDGLFTHLEWHLASGIDPLGLYCSTASEWQPLTVINGRPIYANEAIHGVSVWTCLAPHVVGNEEPLQVDLWYDIRLHSPTMLRLATRMVGTAMLVLPVTESDKTLEPPVITEGFTLLPCPAKPGTTLELEGCAEHRIVGTDTAINQRVRAIFSLLGTPSARARFARGERAWLERRRNLCESRADVYDGGSAAPVAFAECVADQNVAHLEDLRVFERALEPAD
jgi:uncharacterized protein YecT (DUF1311 family)